MKVFLHTHTHSLFLSVSSKKRPSEQVATESSNGVEEVPAQLTNGVNHLKEEVEENGHQPPAKKARHETSNGESEEKCRVKTSPEHAVSAEVKKEVRFHSAVP